MADKKVSELTAVTTVGSGGLIYTAIDLGGGVYGSRKITMSNLNAELDHGTLAGIADDDHTQYAKLAGRSGGQTLQGGTADNDDLNLVGGASGSGASVVAKAHSAGSVVTVAPDWTRFTKPAASGDQTSEVLISHPDSSYQMYVRTHSYLSAGYYATGSFSTIANGVGDQNEATLQLTSFVNGTNGYVNLSTVGDNYLQGDLQSRTLLAVGGTGFQGYDGPGVQFYAPNSIGSPRQNHTDVVTAYAWDYDSGDCRLYVKSEKTNEPVIIGNNVVETPQGFTSSTGNLCRGFLKGLTLSNSVSDSDHDIDIAVGAAWDNANDRMLVLASGLTKQLDASWSAGTDAGGLDTGSIDADTGYHVWLIQRSDTGNVDALFSTSATSPTMPASYDRKRRIGWILTDASSNIIGFIQTGDIFQAKRYFSTFLTTVTNADNTQTIGVPDGFVIRYDAQLRINNASGGVNVALYNPSLTSYNPGIDESVISTVAASDINTVLVTGTTDTSSQIIVRSTAASTNVALTVIRYYDRRGQDDYS
jgi:hypothetical protein